MHHVVDRRGADGGSRTKRIVIGVTIDDSLQFHNGLPAALVEDGWEVHIVSGNGRRMRALAELDGVETHPIEMRRGPSPIRDIGALIQWVHLLRRLRPDVTLIGTPKAALLGNLAGAICHVPRRIYNLLGLRVETASGPFRTVLLAMERITAKSATEVLAVSASVERLAVDLRLFRADKSIVLGRGSCNGVDLERFRELARLGSGCPVGAERLVEGLPVIGFVGRLTRDKGLPVLAEALRLLADRGRAVQLLVVGGVDDSSGQTALRTLSSTGQTVVTTGYQEDPDPYYALMDVFCLPSLREGLPNVVLESMASHTVVIASNATGNIDLVSDGQTGILVEKHSGEQLAQAIEHAIDDPAGSEAMAKRAYDFVAEELSRTSVQQRIRSYLKDRSAGVEH